MKIAVDAMGGDLGPQEIVKGVIEALKEYDVSILLVGKKEILSNILSNYNYDRNRLEILNADEEIVMTDSPLAALRQKKNSSIAIGLDAVKKGDARCFVSTGNTGAVMAAATIKLKLIKGIERAGIATVLPNAKKSVTILMDVGASVDSKPEHLLHYSIMASEYAKIILNKSEVTVGLLNVGEEETKGNELAKDTFVLLKKCLPNFYGNVEGRDIYKAKTDVVICDGFTGNTILKVSEGLAETLFDMIREGIKEKLQYKIGALLLKPFFKKFKKTISYSEYGGASLLGVNGYVIICHGRSTYIAIKNAVRVSLNFCKQNVNDSISEKINALSQFR
ncbi:MAG TPA: phosphate acyltransferase PlsX [bacterium]|nr:phosphate acyltransferase PlsX [bacterium]